MTTVHETETLEERMSRIARHVAFEYRSYAHIEMDDLQSIAYLAMLKSLPRWDKNKSISSFFARRARGSIIDFLRKERKNEGGREFRSRDAGKNYVYVRPSTSFSEESEDYVNPVEMLESPDATPDLVYLSSQVCQAAESAETPLLDWDDLQIPLYLAEASEKIRYQLLEAQRARFAAMEESKRQHLDPSKDIDSIIATLLKKGKKGARLVKHTYCARDYNRRRRN
jgi:RNA polymerase sigma factor (sigma-70 family)